MLSVQKITVSFDHVADFFTREKLQQCWKKVFFFFHEKTVKEEIYFSF